MRIGNRLFPYPVLNRDTELSEYTEDAAFGFDFDRDEAGAPIIKGEELVLANIHYNLNCAPIEDLVKQGRVAGALIVECSASMYRKRFEISDRPNEIRIPLKSLNGSVSISCYLYAVDDIEGFGGDGLPAEYDGVYFDIDKYDILAVDDGVTFKVELDVAADNKVASIFTIVKLEQVFNRRISYESTETGITIQLPSRYYDCYDNIKMHSDYNNIAFAMIAVPALTGCLFDIQRAGYEEMDDITDALRWFNSVKSSYMRATGRSLDMETFSNTNPFELAQTVLNDSSCRGLEDFNELLLGAGADEDEGAEAENE